MHPKIQKKPGLLAFGLGALQMLIGLSAAAGGVGLIAENTVFASLRVSREL
jgi:hypothetical protein